MTKTPRWHERILVFNNYYTTFVDLCEKYDKGLMIDFSEKQQLFNYLKVCYEFYCKSLRDILNFNGICLFLPAQILLKAQSEGIIDDADLWLKYIKDLNIYYQTYGAEEQKKLVLQIIEKYKSKFTEPYKYLNNFFNSLVYEEKYEYKELPRVPKPAYNRFDIGIYESSYNLILNYLKQNKNIRYVWLHGSRAKGNARKNSDIDLLIDIDVEHKEICKKDFDRLAIPYRVDFVSIQDSSCELFLSKVLDEAKLIYRAEDF